MKIKISALIIGAVFNFLFLSLIGNAQNISINSDGTPPHNSALLDLSSEDKGFIITRSDTANIASPAFGLMTLQPTDSCLYVFSGSAWKGLGGAGENCPQAEPEIPSCSIDSKTTILEVTSIKSAKKWMDRNLGASRKAISKDDASAYGDLYQWGRCTDGHQSRYSSTTTTLSTSDTPDHNKFIINTTSPSDWRVTPNDNLWQGVAGINNPCPPNFRLPTYPELTAELNGIMSAQIAFDSPLKFTVGGKRNTNGSEANVGSNGYYWSSTIYSPTNPVFYEIQEYSAGAQIGSKATGMSVRCIKNN